MAEEIVIKTRDLNELEKCKIQVPLRVIEEVVKKRDLDLMLSGSSEKQSDSVKTM